MFFTRVLKFSLKNIFYSLLFYKYFTVFVTIMGGIFLKIFFSWTLLIYGNSIFCRLILYLENLLIIVYSLDRWPYHLKIIMILPLPRLSILFSRLMALIRTSSITVTFVIFFLSLSNGMHLVSPVTIIFSIDI